ncbi:MAG: TonB family protein [Rhizobium sp.]|nr:TonB family protein [Rhizobium sp.]
MATPGPRIVSINELRFRPANSNDRARAGMQHAFNDVPPCSFAGDDGISPYMGARSGIDGYPDNPAHHEVLHDDVPNVAHDLGKPALTLGSKLLRGGFGLSVFLHAVAAFAIGFVTLEMPDDDALLEGETVIAVEFFSETDSDVTTRVRQVEQEGEDEAIETPVDDPKVEPRQEITEPVKPVEEPGAVEQAKVPEPVVKPVEQPVAGVDQPEILSTNQPSDFQIEAAARQIIEAAKIEPLPDTPPPMLVVPVEQVKVEPATRLAQPLPHPISKPRVIQKAVEAKPAEKPVLKKAEPKPVEKPEPKREPTTKKDEAKKPEPKPQTTVRKKTAARDGNAEADSNKGSSKADKKSGNSQDASQGNSKRKVKGNASTSNYKGLVQRKLERAKKRVRVAARGTVVVSFTIAANGSVVNLRVRKSSGKPAIDKGALDIVRRASPFPAIPPDTGLKSYPVSVPMTFKGN